MSHPRKGPYRLGGLSFVLSGALFLVKYLLDLAAGPPPSNGVEILAWTATNKLALSFTNEVLFFAATFLIPAVFALYQHLNIVDKTKAMVGCGIFAAAVPLLFFLLVVHGRLVYPVYNMKVHDPAIAELIVSVYYGGLHAVGILLGVATVVLSLAMRHAGYGAKVVYLGVAAGVFDIVGAYPDRIGLVLLSVSQVLFAAWFLAVGTKLYRMG